MARIIEIKDFSAPELDVYARMTENQLLNRHEPEKGMFIAESPKVIARALEAGCRPVSLLLENRPLDELGMKVLEDCGDIPAYTASFDVLTQLTGFSLTRGMLCAMYRPPLPKLGEICRDARRVAVLENVVNPTNVGAIFRSAAALGMDAVLLTPGCSNPLYRRAIRVSMGTVFQVPWTFLPGKGGDENSSEEGLAFLRKAGFATVAMALKEDSLSIEDPVLAQQEKLAVFLGTEGDGLASHTIASCDYTAKIPMTGGVDSLNVAAASAVAFWQLGMSEKERNVK